MTRAVVELASEYWKLLKVFQRAILLAPEEARLRLQAHARYADSRLEMVLAAERIRVMSFDGMEYEITMPAIAINADEYVGEENLIVERTIEPAVVQDMAVLMSGKVYLKKANN